MRHLRWTVLAAVAVALSVAPVAGAHHPPQDRHRAVVAPAKGKWLAKFWAQIYSLPVAENPFAGNGDPCLRIRRRVIAAVSRDGVAGPCTVKKGTALMTGFSTAWSSLEDPFPQTRAEQLALALASDQQVVGMTVTVDGGHPVQIRVPQFELFSPQRTVLLPADNILGVDGPQTATLTAHGWNAVVRRLRVGEHHIVTETLFAGGQRSIVPHIVIVVPRRDGGDHGHHDDG